jgi:uncharacterized radical SAM superfamily Fe-S cluster-containing enzyme
MGLNIKSILKRLLILFGCKGFVYSLIRDFKQRKRLRRRKTLQIQVHLVEHCNLNCKYCAHFSPLADEEYVAIESFEKDFKRLADLTGGKLDKIALLGGEPLLHPRITSLFDISRKCFPHVLITCNTNGILLIKQNDEFWNNCKKNNIEIVITKYPIRLNMNELEAKANKYDVALRYFDETIKSMQKIPLDMNGNNAEYNYSKCQQANWCITLKNGKLFTCATIPYIYNFNK